MISSPGRSSVIAIGWPLSVTGAPGRSCTTVPSLSTTRELEGVTVPIVPIW